MSSDLPDVEREIPVLLRETQDRGLRTAAEGLLLVFRCECNQALAWQREAGRALAVEGLETDVLRQGVEGWIGRARADLHRKLTELLE